MPNHSKQIQGREFNSYLNSFQSYFQSHSLYVTLYEGTVQCTCSSMIFLRAAWTLTQAYSPFATISSPFISWLALISSYLINQSINRSFIHLFICIKSRFFVDQYKTIPLYCKRAAIKVCTLYVTLRYVLFVIIIGKSSVAIEQAFWFLPTWAYIRDIRF